MNLEMLVFKERGKPECPEKNLSEQSREPRTNKRNCKKCKYVPFHCFSQLLCYYTHVYRVCARDVIKSKTKKPLKDLSSSDIRGTSCTSVYDFPAQIASFVWKPVHFEFRDYGA